MAFANYSVAEIAERLGVDQTAALGLIKFLTDRDVNLAHSNGSRHTPGVNGRGPSVYSFEEKFEEKLLARLKGRL